MNKIPSVNLADFLSNDNSKKQQFIDDIGPVSYTHLTLPTTPYV